MNARKFHRRTEEAGGPRCLTHNSSRKGCVCSCSASCSSKMSFSKLKPRPSVSPEICCFVCVHSLAFLETFRVIQLETSARKITCFKNDFQTLSLIAGWLLKILFLSLFGFPSVLTHRLEPLSCEKCFSAVKTWRIFALSGDEGSALWGQCPLGSYCTVLGWPFGSVWHQVAVSGCVALYLQGR